MSNEYFAGFDVGGTKALGVVVADTASSGTAQSSTASPDTTSSESVPAGTTSPGAATAGTPLPRYQVIASARESSAGDGMALTKTLANLCEELMASTGQTGTGQTGTGQTGTGQTGTGQTGTGQSSTQTSTMRFETIGLAVAGLSNRTGVVHYSPNLPDIVEFPLAQSLAGELANRLGYQPAVSLDNDANAGTWAEAHLGAGRDCDNFVFVTLGTGIGTGFVVNGRLLQGANGFAGESGHMVVDAHGPAHITGVRGPWEYFASGNALGRMGREAAEAGRFSAGIELAGGTAGGTAAGSAGNGAAVVTSHHVHQAAKANDAEALQILDEYCQQVALGIANLVMIFDPQRVVIGGGVADIGEPLRSGVESHLSKNILGAQYRPMPQVVLAELGVEAIAVGAALMANDLS